MASYYVSAERLKSSSTPSRDEELIPLPAGKWFDTLKDAFDWAEIGNLIGSFLGWEKQVYMLTPKKLVRITKVTEQMIFEDELYEAVEGLKAVYYTHAKTQLNSVYGKTAGGSYSVVVYDVDGTEIDRTYYQSRAAAEEYCNVINKIEMYTAFVEEEYE